MVVPSYLVLMLMSTIQTVLSLAISRHWPIHQLDIKNAFLHGYLSENVYMHQPLGFWDSAHSNYVYLLQRSLYGLKHAPQAWFERFEAYVTRVGFTHRRCIIVTRDSSRIFLSQRKYATEIIKRAHMVSCNPSRCLVDTESKLGDDGDPVSDLTLYRSLAGSLQYLTFTRPNIYYAVQHVCLYMHDPREPRFLTLKRILWYVHGTLDYGL
ncbi:ribonuclease H-like domain-containing protein [Tanacetum coccineum]